MKRISTAVLGAALVTGMAGVTLAPPAFAKKKEEAAKGPQVSPAFGAIFEKGRQALLVKNNDAALAAATEAEALAKTDDEKYYVAFLRYLAQNQKLDAVSAASNGAIDSAPLIGPLDALIANPKTPADIRPKVEFHRAAIAYDSKNWALASQLFAAAQAHGSTDPNLQLYLLKAKLQGGNPAGGMADLDALYASGKPMTEELYKYAINQANIAKLRPDTLKWLQRWVTAYPTPTTWNTAVVFYGISGQALVKLDKKQRVDLYRLLRQTKALPDQNYYEEYAQSVSDIGLPDEAKAVIDEGKATGKIPAVASSNIKALYVEASAAVAAEGSFDALERRAAASPTGPLSAQTGDAYLGRGNYAKSIALYRQALTKGGVNADEVNTHLGIALALSGDKAGAKTAFGAVAGPPRSDIAGFWQVWLDHPPTS